MISLIRAVPPTLYALICAGLAALLIGQTLMAQRTARQLADSRAALAIERAAIAEAAASSQQAQRDTEQRWQSANQEITDAYLRTAQEMADARARADAVGVRLQQAITSSSRRARQDPSAAGSGEAAESSAWLYSELYRRADERAGEVAAFADSANAAGLACERAYEALTR